MSKNEATAPVRSWATERLSEPIRRSLARLARADDVRHVAVMPDVHLARDVCIGTAFATSQLVYPDAVGGDIGCGMSAVALHAFRPEVTPDLARVVHRAIRDAVPVHRRRAHEAERVADLLPPTCELSRPALATLAQTEGPHQIGTLGTGNHFLELQYDRHDERLWLMVHSGSRGLGQAIRAAHVDDATRGRSGLAYLDAATAAGRWYLDDMDWARRFAASNRRAMLRSVGLAVEQACGWRLHDDTYFDCDHNHVRREEHFGSPVFVHRKGAMPAGSEQAGIVPGSMAAPSFHVTGRGVPDALCSSAHGAGRAMSRSEARARVGRRRLAEELRDVYVDPRTIGGLREEAPSAYKDIRTVMKAQRKLVRTDRTLIPVLTHKGIR